MEGGTLRRTMSETSNDVKNDAYYNGRAMGRAEINENPYPAGDFRAAHWAQGYASIVAEKRKADIERAKLTRKPLFVGFPMIGLQSSVNRGSHKGGVDYK